MEKYLSETNYYSAITNATAHKSNKKKKYRWAKYLKDNQDELKTDLLNYAKNFKNAKHKPKEIYDGIQRKKRIILVPTKEEQVIHHMVVNVLKPIFMKSMYVHSYGSIPGRGAIAGKKRKKNKGRGGKSAVEKWIKLDRKNTKYVLKMDIQKYFDSIPHEILKRKLAEIIHDKEFLDILYEIINATEKGIPLGFYTSQWFANYYLTELDHYIKEELHVKYYIRYMDDMVIFSDSKESLLAIRLQINEYLQNVLGLTMKQNWQIFSLEKRFLDFMGFRFYPNKTTLRKTIMLKATRKAKRLYKKCTVHGAHQMLSYNGWLKCTNTYNLYLRHIKPYIDFDVCKRVVSHRDRGDINNGMEYSAKYKETVRYRYYFFQDG